MSDVDAILDQIAYRIMRLRAERGWSQVELAERVGTSQETVCEWECRKHRPTVTMLVRIAKAFDVPVATLFDTCHTE